MTPKRRHELVEAALSYLYSNVDDVNVAFHTGRPGRDEISVDGLFIDCIEEEEVHELLGELRDMATAGITFDTDHLS